MRSIVPLSCASALLIGFGVSLPARAEPGPPAAPSPATQPARATEVADDGPEEAAPATTAEPELITREPAATTAAQPAVPGPPAVTELATRLQALERVDPLDDSVRRPLEFGRAALERARASRASGDVQAELRTLRLARAAVELAEARSRLLRERTLFLTAQARRNTSTAEQATAKRAMERERARARELERESAAP